MTLPALQRIRERFPQAKITLLTPEHLGPLWRAQPLLDAVLEAPRGSTPWTVASNIRRLQSDAKAPFDLALVLPNSPRSALEMWLAGIPRRVGYAHRLRNWFLTERVPARLGRRPMHKRSAREVKELIRLNPPRIPEPPALVAGTHQIHDYLHLAATLGASPEPLSPRLEVLRGEVEAVESKLLSARLKLSGAMATKSKPVWLGLNPSAAYGPAKRWPVENFAAVGREVSRRDPNRVWVVLGNAQDAELCEEITRQTGGQAINFSGKTSLRELLAVLKLCRVLLTNDSGPMHAAAALDTPVVVPFGSTSPELTGPGLPGEPRHHLLTSQAPCSPCFRRSCPIDLRCMTGITPSAITAAVLEALDAADQRQRPP